MDNGNKDGTYLTERTPGLDAALGREATSWCVAVQPKNSGSKNVFLYDAQLDYRRARDVFLTAKDEGSRYFPAAGESNFVLAGNLERVIGRLAAHAGGITSSDIVAPNAVALAVKDYASLAKSLHLSFIPQYDENEPWD